MTLYRIVYLNGYYCIIDTATNIPIKPVFATETLAEIYIDHILNGELIEKI